MKTTDPRDPLDQKIDALFASRPIKPSPDFAARVLAAAEATEAAPATPRHSIMAPVLRFALPIAAVFALALTLAQFNFHTTPATPATNLTAAEAQEIFLLEEGLSGLSTLTAEGVHTNDLLTTLEALTFNLES